MATKTKLTKRDEIEYNQVCEHYRQGVRSLFDSFKFYLIFQGGLGTLAGAIFSRSDFQSKINVLGRVNINFPLLIISIIGIFAAIGAPFIAQRMYRYHDTVVARAAKLERAYDMRLITELGAVWSEAGSYKAATGIAFVLFALVGTLWLIGIANSVEIVSSSR